MKCVLIFSGCTSDSCEKTYFATGGTLSITSIGGPGTHFTGTLKDVTLVEVTIDDTATSTPVSGGQSWCLANVPFDGLNGCNTTADCSAGVCNETDHVCVECLNNTDCTGNENGALCDTNYNTCVQCLSNTDCAGNANGAICDTNYNVCVECTKDADCNGNAHGAYCNTDAGTCNPCTNSFRNSANPADLDMAERYAVTGRGAPS